MTDRDRLRILADQGDPIAIGQLYREAKRAGIIPVLTGAFAGEPIGAIAAAFEVPYDTLAAACLLVAAYDQEDYEGRAHVVYEKDGKLWEVNAYHCSCMGLEEQWDPEETGVVELRFRLDRGDLGSHADALRSILDWIFGPQVSKDPLFTAMGQDLDALALAKDKHRGPGESDERFRSRVLASI